MMCTRNNGISDYEPRVVVSTVGNLVRGKITALDWFLENMEIKLNLGGRIFRSAK